ncbi:hypothetical protein HF324_27610 [Chitinophaga oryzae]|uniref:Uncharacterized protein n=1 Tax=Chitinophaga oryzae TaxID=2725414 RepID=A0AAE7DA33_9BACT|nr:hypothetical protein [Chitinophaga oryzae]QJB34892.1 hypothetical protein HF329_27750 [Chitinophaga oryzae]QJB41403.1 hypothetical protein HF324_27610 [Chitinophaga oryzae]
MYKLKKYSVPEYAEMVWTICNKQFSIEHFNNLRFLSKTRMEIGDAKYVLTEHDRREVDNAMMHRIMRICVTQVNLGRVPEVYWCGDSGFSPHVSGRDGFLPLDVGGFAEVLHNNDIELRKNYQGRLIAIERYIHPTGDPNFVILLGTKHYGKLVEVDALMNKINEIDPAVNPSYEKGQITGFYNGSYSQKYIYSLRPCFVTLNFSKQAITAIEKAIGEMVTPLE